jgi:methylase of polypeptide subunit release factors
MLALKGKLHLAPIENIPLHNVLDLATGTGIWATDFGASPSSKSSCSFVSKSSNTFDIFLANAFPQANVLGTDLSPIQPL